MPDESEMPDQSPTTIFPTTNRPLVRAIATWYRDVLPADAFTAVSDPEGHVTITITAPEPVLVEGIARFNAGEWVDNQAADALVNALVINAKARRETPTAQRHRIQNEAENAEWRARLAAVRRAQRRTGPATVDEVTSWYRVDSDDERGE